VAASDYLGLRARALASFAAAGVRVDCPGPVGRNVGPIAPGWEAKRAFLARRALALCPENTWGPAYATEKPVQAALSGAVPVYWGDLGPAERAILDTGRIVRFRNDDPVDCARVAAACRALLDDPVRLHGLLARPAFLPGAADEVARLRAATLSFLAAVMRDAVAA
jgi:hypothetical protein